MCMRLGLNQARNGFLSRLARSMKLSVASRNSWSTVSMRFLSSGPVSSQFCLPHLPKRGSFYGATARRSGGADLAEPNADCEHDTTANDNLDDGVSELAAHETIANERL